MSTDACTQAVTNVRHGVNAGSRFPRNVFLGSWTDFFFFDSDWMRDAGFVEHAKMYLVAERGTCACVMNLDSLQTTGAAGPNILLIQDLTAPSEYRQLLMEESLGGVDGLARLACASDTDEWCIYCEPNNEIAVIAFRHSENIERYLTPLSIFHATRLEDALADPPFYGFTDRALSKQWRDEFRREYPAR